jgi:hypothetical protein
LNGAAVEDLAFDRSALEHGPFGALESVEAGGEQRLKARWDDQLLLRTGHRQYLCDEERVPTRCPRDPIAHRAADPVGDQPLDVLGRQRLQPERRRPCGPPIGQLGPRDADEQDRRAR